MLKITIVDTAKQRRLVMEGMLVAPWAAELRQACEVARANLDGRELVVELKSLLAVSQEGEHVLLALMNDGVKLHAQGVFTKHVLKQASRRNRANHQETTR